MYGSVSYILVAFQFAIFEVRRISRHQKFPPVGHHILIKRRRFFNFFLFFPFFFFVVFFFCFTVFVFFFLRGGGRESSDTDDLKECCFHSEPLDADSVVGFISCCDERRSSSCDTCEVDKSESVRMDPEDESNVKSMACCSSASI